MRTTHAVLAFALSTLLGCGSDAPTSPAAIDKDRDGFTEAQGDCNDQAATINPNGKVEVAACVWIRAEWDCPRGSDQRADLDDAIQISLVNNSCSIVSVTDATVQVFVQEAHGTYNHNGQTWTTQHAPFSPSNASPGNGVSIRVDPDIACTNGRGGGSYNVYTAKVTLQTSAGVVEALTTNTRTDTFPFRGEDISGFSGQ